VEISQHKLYQEKNKYEIKIAHLSLLASLESLYFADIILTLGTSPTSIRYKAHKAILSARSSYFKSLFLEDKPQFLSLDLYQDSQLERSLRHDYMPFLLHCMYHGICNVEQGLARFAHSFTSLLELMKVCGIFALSDVMSYVEMEILPYIREENAIRIFRVARRFRASQLIPVLFHRLAHVIPKIENSSEFLDLKENENVDIVFLLFNLLSPSRRNSIPNGKYAFGALYNGSCWHQVLQHIFNKKAIQMKMNTKMISIKPIGEEPRLLTCFSPFLSDYEQQYEG